jgi:hypothetical protein
MKNLLILKITTYPRLIIFFFGLCLFASCSEKEGLVPTDKAISFDSKTYKFENQDPGSIAARKAIDAQSKGKSSRTIYYQGGSANYGFNPSGYQYGVIQRYQPGQSGGTYRETAFVQNFLPVPITVIISSQGSRPQSNISFNIGSISQPVYDADYYYSSRFKWTIPANTYTYAYLSFDHHLFGSEGWSDITTLLPIVTEGTGPSTNGMVYPIGYAN